MVRKYSLEEKNSSVVYHSASYIAGNLGLVGYNCYGIITYSTRKSEKMIYDCHYGIGRLTNGKLIAIYLS